MPDEIKNRLAPKNVIARLRGGGVGALLARGAIGALMINVVGVSISLLVQIVLARLMSLAAYGTYIYVISWLTILLLPSKLGLDTSILRYAGIYSVKEEWAHLRGLLMRSRQIVFSTSLVVALIVFSVSSYLHVRLTRDMEWAFFAASIALPILALTDINTTTLRGLLHTIRAQLPDVIMRPLLLIVLALVASQLMDLEITGTRAVSLYGIASFLTLIVSWVLVFERLPESESGAREYKTRQWLAVALPLMLLSGFQIAMNQLDTIMVGMLLGPEEAGVYSVAARVAMFVLFGLNAVNVIIAPIIAGLCARGKNKEIQRIVNLAGIGLVAFSVPVAALLILMGHPILGLFGEEFTSGQSVLTILCGAQLVNALSGSVGYLMTMTGHQRQAGWILGTAVVINFFLNWLLIPNYGIEGAAVGTGLAIAFWNTALALMVWQLLKVNVYAFLFQFPSLIAKVFRDGE